jgi:hypothetical protein
MVALTKLQHTLKSNSTSGVETGVGASDNRKGMINDYWSSRATNCVIVLLVAVCQLFESKLT